MQYFIAENTPGKNYSVVCKNSCIELSVYKAHHVYGASENNVSYQHFSQVRTILSWTIVDFYKIQYFIAENTTDIAT